MSMWRNAVKVVRGELAYAILRERFWGALGSNLAWTERVPYERADIVSDQYDDWRIKNAYLMGFMNLKAAAFLQTFKDYPPSQIPASFTIDQVVKDIDRKIE